VLVQLKTREKEGRKEHYHIAVCIGGNWVQLKKEREGRRKDRSVPHSYIVFWRKLGTTEEKRGKEEG
jgi:hypothetical protein